jgi:ribonuclease E
VFNEDFKDLVVQGDDAWDTVEAYVAHVSPELTGRLTRFTGEGDVFHNLRIDEQLAKALDRKVWLPSGGSLVIDRTEAMTVVDVNTGKFVGSGGNLEQTVTRNNMEAAEEIVRQLRLRDIGGIIVIDFIDMVLESNRDLVLRRLTECLGRDRTKHQVAEVTSLGLVQMTRKRVGQGLLEVFSEPCEHCRGRGVIVSTDPVDEKRRGGGNGAGNAGTGTGGGAGGNGRRERSGGPRDVKESGSKDVQDTAPAEEASDTVVVEAEQVEGSRSGGRRSRGRRGRGQSGEDRAAEDAAVLAGTVADEAPAAEVSVAEVSVADEPAVEEPAAGGSVDATPEDAGSPEVQVPLMSNAVEIVPPLEEPVVTGEDAAVGTPEPETAPEAAPEAVVPEALAVETVPVQPVDAPAARPRRRRAASRPAGPPVS